ncbi:type II toxin-antitoxin system PemK/MazF family toxin [Candidatus Poribacteria bacterium]|nr:type II toxin-antitoxin system PemK/MazF family toxin [Candidatus Poribacteria bacterium]
MVPSTSPGIFSPGATRTLAALSGNANQIQKSESPEFDNDSIVKLEQIFTIERSDLADQLFITHFRKATMQRVYEKLRMSLNFSALR